MKRGVKKYNVSAAFLVLYLLATGNYCKMQLYIRKGNFPNYKPI